MTDKERIKILKRAKNILIAKKRSCICMAIKECNIPGIVFNENIWILFPELLKHKPKYAIREGRWWKGLAIKTRLKVLDKVIIEIKAKSNA